MTTRVSLVAAGDDNPSKRRRVESVSEGVASFAVIDDNCLLEIMKFIDAEDLNSFAICSRRCREARSDPSLDQTRTGTIVCTPNTSLRQFCNASIVGGWSNAFSGSRTRLRVVGFNRVGTGGFISRKAQLTGVTSLHLSNCRHVISGPCAAMALILPNLREVDFSHLRTSLTVSRVANAFFCRRCPHLSRFTWKCATLYLDGRDFKDAVNLADLYLDGCRFYHPKWEDEGDFEEEPTDGSPTYYMLMQCKRLERLSINYSTWFEDEVQLVSQGMIIKFVRHTPTLRWLRSDLTEENVVMLHQERPDITFVTD